MTAAKTPANLDERPVRCAAEPIEPAWIDYNGHLNMAYYHVLFDRALDRVYDALALGQAYTDSGAGSLFTREVRVNYLQEARLEDALEIHWQLLDCDAKRLHFCQRMVRYEDQTLLATSEQLAIHVDLESRRSAPLPAEAAAKLKTLLAQHQGLEPLEGREAPLGIRRVQP